MNIPDDFSAYRGKEWTRSKSLESHIQILRHYQDLLTIQTDEGGMKLHRTVGLLRLMSPVIANADDHTAQHGFRAFVESRTVF